MLKLSFVSFSYGDKTVLKDFSLTVDDGECVLLKGDSGSGKTTVALLLCRLRTPNSGEILSPEKISVVFQEDRFTESLSLSANLKAALTKEEYALSEKLLKAVGLYDLKKKKISELSGGMKRRLALVRAIAYGGDALILDEAFNGLDGNNKKICAELIKKYFIEQNKPVLFITHIESDAELLNARTEYISKDR